MLKNLLVFILIVLILAISVWTFVPVSETIHLPELRKDSEPKVRFALVTDLHSCKYGKNQKTLTDILDEKNPDAILLSGDIFDDKLSNRNTKIFLENVSQKYKCYYVTGNHEFMCEEEEHESVSEIKSYLRNLGVTVLEGNCVETEINDVKIDICGADDAYGIGDSAWFNQIYQASKETNPKHIKLLLSHRPERVQAYSQFNFDLVLCGHAHGGQWYIPFLNRGVFAPQQHFFAKYVSGKHILSNGTIMVVSRGLSKEKFLVPRFGNPPEIVFVEF